MNLLIEANKPIIKKTIVIYAGRFQPFHPGHYAVYKHLVQKFGKDSVYIASSDDTSGPKSPLRFKEKKKIATEIFDVPSNRFVRVKNPYRPAEILDKYDEKTTQYIAALGEKDADRLSAGHYFKPYKGKAGYGYGEIGYTYNVPMQSGGISATDIRKGISHKNEKVAREFFKKIYPKFDAEIFQSIRSKLIKEDMPGGAFTGLTSPAGYINGAPDPKDVKKMRKKIDSETTNENLYNPIQQIIQNVITEEDFEKFSNEYFGGTLNEKEESEFEKMGLVSRGFGRYSKDPKGPITHKSVDGKIKALTPAEVEKENEKQVEKEKGTEKQKSTPTDSSSKAKEQNPQALTPTDLKSDAEKFDNKSVDNTIKIKAKLDKEKSTLSKEDNESADKVNNPESKERKGFMESVKKGLSKAGKALAGWAKHKAEMVNGTVSAVKDLATTGKLGAVKDKNGKTRHFDEFVEKDQNGKTKYEKYEVDILDKKGNPTGKKKTEKRPVFKDTLTSEEKELAESSFKKRKNQIKDCKHFAMDVGILVASMAVGGAAGAGVNAIIAGKGLSAAGQAALHGANIFGHGVGGFASHLTKDIAKHAALETLGAEAIGTGIGGVGLSVATGGMLEMLSADEKPDSNKFIVNFFKKFMEKFKGYKLSDEQMLKSIENYKKNKPKQDASDLLKGIDEHYVSSTGMFNRKLSPQQKIDKLNPARAKQKSKIWHKTFSHHNPDTGDANEISDNLTESRINSINDFVEWATNRLKLSEKPKVQLVTKKEYSENNLSLGGYSSEDKSIIVSTEGRLIADILRTIAHEMVHRKQDELGLIKDVQKDGATGSPIENQANAIAGILLREYGKRNKKIYVESISVGGTIVSDKMDKVLGKLKEKLQEKFKSLQSVNYNTGIKEYTFIFGDNNEAFDFQNKFKGYNGQKLEFDRSNEYSKEVPPYYVVTFRTPNSVEMRETIKKVGDKYVVYPKKGGKRLGTHSSKASAQKQLAAIEINKEDINIPVNTGDEVLMGKFKNKKITVKDIGEDDYGMPTINGRQATTFRTTTDSLNEVSSMAGADDQPNGMFLPKGSKRVLGKKDGVNKEDKWFTNGGYTQVDFPTAGAIFGDEDELRNIVKYSDDNIPKFTGPKTKFTKGDVDTLNEKLILEGGAAGHMAHPFDDMQLTFGDLKNIITGALNGELGIVKEKLDGQALAISWKNGRLIAARNKGHLENAGMNAMGIEDVANKFAGRGALTNAYNFAMKDLNAAISGLSKKQQEKIFNEGRCFMNIEVLWPESANVIPYGQALLVFHNTTCYDDSGKAIGADAGAARMLAGMINQINANVQNKYTIKGPAVTDIPKNQELSSKQNQFLSKLNKLQSEFNCKDNDTVAVYHQRWWANYIDEKAPTDVDKLTKDALIRRWAFGDKSFRLNTISNKELQDWAMKTDKNDIYERQRENMSKFEDIFLGVGAEVLQFVSSAATVNPDAVVRSMKDELKTAIASIKKSNDTNKIEKFNQQLKKLNKLGGAQKIVPIEGIVFSYKDKVYKLTGTFAPLNQILGLFKYA